MKKIIYLSLSFILVSCFYGSFKGLTSGYDKEKNSLKIVFLDTLKDVDKLDLNTIYGINANTLREELSFNEKSLIYIWSPNCHSDICLPLYTVQRICDEKNIQLFVFVEYYDKELVDYFGQTKNPLFSINHLYYKTNFVNKYTRKFIDDLAGYKIDDSINWYRYYYFEHEKLSEISRNI